MYLTIFKWALLAFICVGISIILITYIRRVKKVRLRREPNPDLGYLSNVGVPPTPLPEWAYWSDNDEIEEER